MGVGAFLMAEFLGVSYWKIAIAATLPALLYVICIFSGVHFEGKRVGLRPVPRELIPKAAEVVTFRRLGRFVLPMAMLLYMIASGRSLMLAAIYASAMVVVLYVLEDFSVERMGKRLWQVGAALHDAGRALAYIGVLIAAANIAVALVGVTGVGIKLSQLILSISNGSLFPALLVAALVALVLGTGLPTTPSYVLAAAVVAAPLVQAGVSPLGAHLFLFYFACISDITPPICAAVYITAGIARTPWLPVAFLSVRLGLAKYIVPFVFVYSPALLLTGAKQDIVTLFALCAIGVVAMSAATSRYFVYGPLRWPETMLLGVGGLGLMMPSVQAKVIAGMLLLIAYGMHFAHHRKQLLQSLNDTKEERS
jgi:TRAP transporter 4TM/12TM fusion protein